MILRSRADQPNVPFVDVWQEGVLLWLVEAMNLIDENSSASAVLAGTFGVGHDLLDFLDPREHGAELDEIRSRHAGNDFRQRGLAGPGRAPENQGPDVIAFDLRSQGFARPGQMLLADTLV